jgi:Protein of unknown function (DUF4242)
MKKISLQLGLLFASFFLISLTSTAQTSINPETKNVMHTYVIERDIPGAGKFTPEQFKAISEKSCGVIKEIGSSIYWDHSYVTENKIFCIYKAENIDIVKEHATKGGFPANAIYEVETIISPATATATIPK